MSKYANVSFIRYQKTLKNDTTIFFGDLSDEEKDEFQEHVKQTTGWNDALPNLRDFDESNWQDMVIPRESLYKNGKNNPQSRYGRYVKMYENEFGKAE